jgi:hypothetical protein
MGASTHVRFRLRCGDTRFLSPFSPLDDSTAVSFKKLSASNGRHHGAILRNSSRFSLLRISVAPVFDYTDSREKHWPN